MKTTMSVSEARAALPEIVERVLAGEEVTLTRHGQPVAVVVRPDSLRARRADSTLATAARVHELIEKAATVPLRDRPSMTPRRAAALLAEVRDGRIARPR